MQYAAVYGASLGGSVKVVVPKKSGDVAVLYINIYYIVPISCETRAQANASVS